MTYATCLRLACRHPRSIITPYHRTRCVPPRHAALVSSVWLGSVRFSSRRSERRKLTYQSHSDEPSSDAKKSEDEDLDPFESVFKKQRRQDLASASAGDNPLFADPWGRMEEGAKAAIAKQKERIKEDKEMQEVAEELDRLEEEEEQQDAKPRRVPIPDFLMEFHLHEASGEKVNIMGRIRAKRMSGKGLMFLDIQNEFQKVQVMVSRQTILQQPTQEPETEKDAGGTEDVSTTAGGDLEEALSISRRPVEEEAAEIAQNHFAVLRNLLQVGDHISVTGLPTRTKAGEQTLKATELPQLVSPTMEQIPDKLTDEKTKMANRPLDMLVNKDVSDTLRLRAEITRYMREHFYSKRFLEYQTPILAQNAGGAVARPFTTRATEFEDKELAMRVAPELWLKRLVVGGVDKVFEIGPAFRNEGIDATHNPEFTMCEFYSAYSNLAELISETEELLCGMAVKSHMLIRDQLTALPPVDLSKFKRPFKQVEFIPGLEAALGLRLPRLTNPGALPELLAVLKLAGIPLPGEAPNTLPRLLDRLAAMYLEPLSFNEPLFITNHPACMSPLSKSYLCLKTYQLVSARAEIFMGGRELANMYEEENSPREQRKKLAEHQQLVNTVDGTVVLEPTSYVGQIEQASEEAYDGESDLEDEEDYSEEDSVETDDHGEASPLDQSFIKALDYGLPPTGGWGCGVERLVMLFSGAQRISDVLSFGTLRNVVGLTAKEVVKAQPIADKPVEVKESRAAEKRRLRAAKQAAKPSTQTSQKSRFGDSSKPASIEVKPRFGGKGEMEQPGTSDSGQSTISLEDIEKMEQRSRAKISKK